MKIRFASLLVLASGLLLSLLPSVALAQITGDIEADIPFKFVVENTTLGPGKYVIHPMTMEQTTMEIRSESGHVAVAFLTEQTEAANVPAKTELIFDKYGTQEFLSKIFVEGNRSGVQVAKSRTEKQLQGKGQKPTSHSHPAKLRKAGAKKK